MRKVNTTIIAVISAIILFIILTLIQKSLINSKPTVEVLIANADIKADSELKSEYFSQVSVPLNIILNTKAITSIDKVLGKFAKENINKGQIMFEQDVSSSDKLKLLKEADGLERIAIKIKSPENAIAYQIRPKDKINLYFSGRYGNIKETVQQYNLNYINKEDNSMYTVCVLRDIEVLGIYDSNGISIESDKFEQLDSIVIATDRKNAELINNLRAQGTFDVTR